MEAPAVAQDGGQQIFMLATINPVQPVIGAHQRPRLALAHGYFKGWQIDFKQGATVDQRIDHHALGLLIIDGKMFQAGAGARALHASNKAGRHLTGHIRVFGVIFEIAPA